MYLDDKLLGKEICLLYAYVAVNISDETSGQNWNTNIIPELWHIYSACSLKHSSVQTASLLGKWER